MVDLPEWVRDRVAGDSVSVGARRVIEVLDQQPQIASYASTADMARRARVNEATMTHLEMVGLRAQDADKYPVFRIDKLGMAQEAEREGWSDYMDMTWFCHSPVGGKPCGVCGPCVYTIEEGLARRIPPSRRAISFLYRHLALPLKGPLRQVRASLRG